MPDRLNDMLAAFAEHFPNTQVHASTTTDEDAIQQISAGAADFAFVTAVASYRNIDPQLEERIGAQLDKPQRIELGVCVATASVTPPSSGPWATRRAAAWWR